MNILVWPHIKFKAQYLLRHLWPAMQLMKNGYNIKVVDPNTLAEFAENEDVMADIFAWADVVATFFSGTSMKLLEACHDFNKKFIIDVDDYVLGVDPTNPSYRSAGLKDYALPDGTPWWVDGVNYSKDVSAARQLKWLQMLENTDALTVTTGVLGDFYAPFLPEHDNIWVLPNSLDLSYYKPWNHPQRDTIRIGWQGGASHILDLKVVEKPLREILDKYPHVELVWMGQGWKYFDESLPRMEFHPWVESETFYLKLGSLDLDIGLCPLVENTFNMGKSNLKQIEYGAFNVPSVVSTFKYSPFNPPQGIATGEYEQVAGCLTVDTSKNRPEADVEQDWFNAIERLVLDAGLRKELGASAREYVSENFNIEHNWRYWASCYETVNKRIITDLRGNAGGSHPDGPWEDNPSPGACGVP